MTAIYVLAGISVLALGVALTALMNRRASRRAALCAEYAIPAAEALRTLADGRYVRHSSVERWTTEHPEARKLLLSSGERARLASPELQQRYSTVEPILRDPAGWVDVHNRQFVVDRCEELSGWLDTRLPNPLTEEQRRAVVTDEDANLVVAGAGSGKTVTVVAKVAYLIEHMGVRPSEILVLAFNRTVAGEVGERISALGLECPEVSTFHAKGLQVMADAMGRKPSVSALATDPIALGRFLETALAALTEQAAFRELLARWWVDLRVEAWELRQDTPDERLRKERSLGLRTLDGTAVRSQSEVKVGDWLTLHGLAWEHETRYPHSPPSTERSDYTPDFYLPDLDIWIEVWACDAAERKFPPEIAAERYREDMSWKRMQHEEHGTVLVEINQTDIWGGRLSEVLESRIQQVLDERLRARAEQEEEEEGVEGEDTADASLVDHGIQVEIDPVRTSFNPFVNLIASFLSLFRGGGWSPGEVVQRAESERDHRFLDLFWPFLDAYEAHLEAEGKIDFDAMLIEAARALEQSPGPHKTYRYIIVDEYQDTSRARFELIRQLRGSPSGSQLFLVGDDWQSVYRFAGADITYFTQAEQHFGRTARTDLGRTFRLPSHVAALSTHFVTRNRSQLDKRIEPRPDDTGPGGVSVRLHRPGAEAEAVQSVLSEIAAEGGPDATVLLLARYNATADRFSRLGRDGSVPVQALTVHRAKGLEADYAIVCDLSCGTYGFPAELDDDPVLRLLLGDQHHFPNAEERRLFYVALTRARSRVFLLGDAFDTSPFIQELLEPQYAAWVDLSGNMSERHRCPRCRGRTIQRRDGPYGPFWGCMHYPACYGRLPDCTNCGAGVAQLADPHDPSSGYRCTLCGHASRTCPACRTGALIERAGRRGRFLGCSEWRSEGRGCGHTEPLRNEREEEGG